LPEVSQKVAQKVAQKLLQKSQKLLSVTKVAKKAKITQNAKSCSKQRKLFEIRKVPKKLPSNLWQALGQTEQSLGHRLHSSSYVMNHFY